MQTEDIKQEAHRLLENLPDQATWEDLMYRIYVRQSIEAGIKDSDEGEQWMSRMCGKDLGCPYERPFYRKCH